MLQETIGGALRPSDPRRYLVEAMVGAMNADGHVDPRELEVLHRRLAEHALFERLPADVARLFIDLASDAVRHASDGRVRAIARGLPTRTHRLAAYAMACEICVADDHFHQAEVEYLLSLERRMRLAQSEATDLLRASHEHRAMEGLEEKLRRLGQLMPLIVECFALQHCQERRVLERHKRRLVEFLKQLIDLHTDEAEIRARVERALDPLDHNRNVKYGMLQLAKQLSDPADRYWMAVYVAANYGHRGIEAWRDRPFVQLMCSAFAIPTLDAVADHATRLTDERQSPTDRSSRLLGMARAFARSKTATSD